ncbi:C3HC4 type (RING finger) domain-containing protein [Hexamita inflata]|uniref:C3HC4 type (RING finger) domain-containing protein n=1 Tax=Hexamita inflata TaxID=28002 RepID=A0ABP1GUD6_9EUKA
METICPICLDIPNYPIALTCGHVLCYLCIEKWKQRSLSCPVCKIKITNNYQALFFGKTDGVDNRSKKKHKQQEKQNAQGFTLIGKTTKDIFKGQFKVIGNIIEFPFIVCQGVQEEVEKGVHRIKDKKVHKQLLKEQKRRQIAQMKK